MLRQIRSGDPTLQHTNDVGRVAVVFVRRKSVRSEVGDDSDRIPLSQKVFDRSDLLPRLLPDVVHVVG
jgi:hypothetical protein